jgi:hypothetical protein
MQTVMLNSPRRSSLAVSTAGSVPVTASNKIAFTNCTGALSVSEEGITGTYPRYRDVNLTLNVEDKATGTATVNITATGTAINNFHYQLLTPSLTFAGGDNFKDVKIRVFDNAEVDGNKTIILNYSILGTGVTAGTAAQSVTVTVIDDDTLVFRVMHLAAGRQVPLFLPPALTNGRSDQMEVLMLLTVLFILQMMSPTNRLIIQSIRLLMQLLLHLRSIQLVIPIPLYHFCIKVTVKQVLIMVLYCTPLTTVRLIF